MRETRLRGFRPQTLNIQDTKPKSFGRKVRSSQVQRKTALGSVTHWFVFLWAELHTLLV